MRTKKQAPEKRDLFNVPFDWYAGAQRLWGVKELCLFASVPPLTFEQMYMSGAVPICDFVHALNVKANDTAPSVSYDPKRVWRLWLPHSSAVLCWVEIIPKQRNEHGIAPFSPPDDWFARCPKPLISLNTLAARAWLGNARSLYNAIRNGKVPAPRFTYGGRLLYELTPNLNDWIEAAFDTFGHPKRIHALPNPRDFDLTVPVSLQKKV